MISAKRPYHRFEGGDTRLCARCGERKPLSEFRFQRGRPGSYCKPCRNAATQEWRARHHDKLLARRRAKYAAISNAIYRRRREGWER
jgi:recombinational DNA repair protein (RecF pathway)